MAQLSGEEQRSVTHGEFWIPEGERVVYKEVLGILNRAGIPFVVSGLYAISAYTGIYRKTKDLDLFFEPRHIVPAARALREAGFTVKLEQAHWLAKAFRDGVQTDMIYGMGNGLAFIDADWYRYSSTDILAAQPVRIAPAEDLIWHRLFVYERHRSDMADVLHLILWRGDHLDWDRLLRRVGDHWRLLLGQILLFDYVYPGHRRHVPPAIRRALLERAMERIDEIGDPDICQGTLISRFSFSIDVNEWEFRDLRKEATIAARQLPVVKEIVSSDVWD
jgi:hypothetical protein